MPPHCDHCEAVHPLAEVEAGAALVVVVVLVLEVMRVVVDTLLVVEVTSVVDEAGLVVVLLTGTAELLLLTGAEPGEGVLGVM